MMFSIKRIKVKVKHVFGFLIVKIEISYFLKL